MRILCLSFVLMTASASGWAATAEQQADPDFIPPSTAVFSGISSEDKPAPARPASNEQRLSRSITQALNGPQGRANGQQQQGAAAGPKPLDVAPLPVESSPIKDNEAIQQVIPRSVKAPIPEQVMEGGAIGPKVDEIPVIEVYSQEELLALINQRQHLQRVSKIDDCQLVKDIEARARAVMLPAYEYLWGDMLLTGTCIPKNVDLGVDYIYKAAEQGMPAALTMLANYYAKGTYVQKDNRQAAILMHEAASLGDLYAKISWVDMLVKGWGSPLDYEEAYSWLHHSVIADDTEHKRATRLLSRLASKMPPHIVQRAQQYRWQ